MQTCGTVLSYCPHITPGQRELRNGIRTAPICPEIIARPSAVCAQTASRSPDSTFWAASRLFLRCIGPRRPICMRVLHCTCTGCAVGEFKVGRSGVRRSSALGPDRLGHARTFRLGTRTKFKRPVLWSTNLEARPHNSMY
eukprot:scaffold10167_cov106-Isochrysis_galbana.AAC.2